MITFVPFGRPESTGRGPACAAVRSHDRIALITSAERPDDGGGRLVSANARPSGNRPRRRDFGDAERNAEPAQTEREPLVCSIHTLHSFHVHLVWRDARKDRVQEAGFVAISTPRAAADFGGLSPVRRNDEFGFCTRYERGMKWLLKELERCLGRSVAVLFRSVTTNSQFAPSK